MYTAIAIVVIIIFNCCLLSYFRYSIFIYILNFLYIRVYPYLFTFFLYIALMHYRLGEFQESYSDVEKALSLYGNHADSKELLALLTTTFTQI